MSRWDGPYSSAAYSLAKELSKKHRVFYFDHPYTIKDFIAKYTSPEIQRRKSALLRGKNQYTHIKGLTSNFVAVTPQLTFPINKLPPGKLYDYSLKVNNAIVSSAVKDVLKDFEIEDYIFFNSFNPFYDDIIPVDHPPKFRIYQSRDDISESDYVAKHGVKVEKKALEKADYCFATSKELCRTLTTQKVKVKHLPNAADIGLFRKATNPLPQPQELEGIKKQVIGYTGNIGLRLDYELLKKIAEAFPDKILLMVGPRDEKKHTNIDFDKYPNIIFTGGKDISELPAYLQYIDCAIIPFECNKLTASIYPLKVNEYLAAGKPVVSTHFSEDIGDFKEVIHLAKDHDQFITAIHAALKETSDHMVEKRMKAAEKNTWESRVALLWRVIEGSDLLKNNAIVKQD